MQTDKKPPKPKQFDADGIERIDRPKHFAKLIKLLSDRDALTVAGAPGDPRRIRVTLHDGEPR